MNRLTAREIAVHAVYALGFSQPLTELLDERTSPAFYETLRDEDSLFDSPPDEEQADYIRDITTGVEAHLGELDGYIARHAKGWRIERLPRVAVAIIRVCLYELLYRPDVPERAAINAAVEISKHYEPMEISAYINGVLGAFIRELRPESKAAAESETENRDEPAEAVEEP